MRSIKQRGSVLIMVIIAIVLMAVLGVGIYILTTSSSFSELLSGNDYEAYQLAKAGMRFAVKQIALDSSYTGGTYLMPDAHNNFTISVANNVITVTGTTKHGFINFLTANRTLAYDYSWVPGTISFANNMSGFTSPNNGTSVAGNTTNAASAIVPNTTTNTVALGGNVYDSYGTLCYKGSSNVGNCVNGACNFSNGIRAFFNFTFATEDSTSGSTLGADGFTFAIISAITNTSNRTGGAPSGYSMGELMGYAGPGTTSDGLGLVPPKMALTFDTYPNFTNGSYGTPNNICASNSRNDPNPFSNNATFMFWGASTISPTTCTPPGLSVSYPQASFDDNVHGAGSSPQNPTGWDYAGPNMPCKSTPSKTCNFMEDGYPYSVRIEITPVSSTPYTYSLKAWIVRQDNSIFTTTNWSNFKNVILPYKDTNAKISKLVTLSSTDYNNFQQIFFCFTEATGAATQLATLDSLNVFFPTSIIGLGSQTIGAITFSPTTLTVGGTTTASATATSGLPVTFTSTTPTICTVSGTNGSTVTGVAAGTCTIAADQAGDAYYYAAPEVTGSITLSKGNQTIGAITFSPTTLTVGGTTTASATATSGLAVTFTSLTTGVCTVSGTNGSTITGVTAGTCTIAANQAGNANYNAATQVTNNITVGKGNQATLTVNATTPLAYNTSETLSTSGGSGTGAVTYVATGSGGGSCTVSGATLTANSGTGTCNVTATKAADANYNSATSAAVVVTLSKGNQTIGAITFSPTTLTVGGTTTASATATSGLAVTFTSLTTGVCTVSGTNGSTITGVTAGTCTIAANQAGNANYNAATQVTNNITVGKGNQTIGAITFSPTTLTVGGTTTASATATSGLAVTFTSLTTGVCTVSGTNGSTITGVTAGTCTIAANQAGNANYNAATQVTNNITVGKGNQATLTVNATTPLAYLASETLSSTGGSGTGAVTYAATGGGGGSCTVSGTTLTANSGTGYCDVTATKAADTNYNATTSAAVRVYLSTINQATLTVHATTPLAYNTSETLSSTGGSGTGAVTYAATGGGGGSCTVSGTTLTANSGTGYCDVTATKAADTNYNATTSAAVRVYLNCAGYRVWNNTGARYDFKVTGQACQTNVGNNTEITTSTLSTQLQSGETVSRYTRNSTCGTYQGQITYTSAVTADTNGNCQVNYTGDGNVTDH